MQWTLWLRKASGWRKIMFLTELIPRLHLGLHVDASMFEG